MKIATRFSHSFDFFIWLDFVGKFLSFIMPQMCTKTWIIFPIVLLYIIDETYFKQNIQCRENAIYQ